MKKNLNILMSVTTALVLLTGCEVTDELSSSDDKINVSLLGTQTMVIEWEKKYTGYSEVLARQSGVTKRTGYFMTHNSKGNYEMTCTVSSQSSSKVSFSCNSTGSDSLSTYNNFPSIYMDETYNIQGSQGTSHDYKDVVAKIFYSSASGQLQLR